MSRLAILLRYAMRSLRRDATRSLLAVLSITVGVLCLVSMQLFSHTLLYGPMFDDYYQLGGNAQILPALAGQKFSQSELNQFTDWQAQGLITDYAPISVVSTAYLRTPENGRVTILAGVVGIDPQRFPLVGNLRLSQPAQASIADLLADEESALVTRDLADERPIAIGERITLNGKNGPREFVVRGIVRETPDQQGDSVFLGLAGAARLHGGDPVNAVQVLWEDTDSAVAQIEPLGYRIRMMRSLEQMKAESQSTLVLDLMFKGAGVLGLLIGGVSVASTLQVMLQRRKHEIAILKTLGFQRRDLVLMIMLETGLQGLVGGLLGTILGVTITKLLFNLMSLSGVLMLVWSPDPSTIVGGILVGVLTAIIFGIQAILALSSTRPITILRDMPVQTTFRERLAQFALYGLLMIVFASVVGVILGSWWQGIALVLFGAFTLVMMRGVFWLILWVALRIPIPFSPILRIAQSSLRQRINSATLAVIALCVGTFSVTLSASFISDAQRVLTSVQSSDEGLNLLVFTEAEREQIVRDALQAQQSMELISVDALSGQLAGEQVQIQGRSEPTQHPDIEISGTWDENAANVLLPQDFSTNYSLGQAIEVQIEDRTLALTVSGFYTSDTEASILPAFDTLIIPRALTQQFSSELQVFGSFPADELDARTNALGQALTQDLVFSRADLNNRLTGAYDGIFRFALAMGGLAFGTGAVLIANSAGLTALQRRREIGIFKAVGYGQQQVQLLLLSEYGLLGALAGIFGIFGVVFIVFVLRDLRQINTVTHQPMLLLIMFVGTLGIALGSAALVLWSSARQRPLEVLRYE